MKNKLVFLAACAVTVLMPATVKAQYPGITKEAGEISGKIMSEGRQRSDEAWAKALPIVEKEAKELFLIQRIQEIHEKARQIYGYRRMKIALWQRIWTSIKHKALQRIKGK